jgi:hypothetical protein
MKHRGDNRRVLVSIDLGHWGRAERIALIISLTLIALCIIGALGH